MKKLSIISLLLIAGIHTFLNADPILTFFFKDYPVDQAQADHMLQSFKNPKKLAKRSIESTTRHNPIGGIFSTYSGFLQPSAPSGQVVFPRKQSETELDVYITNKISPILMFHNTISHWELQGGADAARYKFSLQVDPKTELLFWSVKKQDLPENKHIPTTNSLIIIAKPKNIYVPTGITLAKEDPNLILPSIYVKKGIASVTNALYTLNLAHFFQPTPTIYKRSKKRYGTVIEG